MGGHVRTKTRVERSTYGRTRPLPSTRFDATVKIAIRRRPTNRFESRRRRRRPVIPLTPARLLLQKIIRDRGLTPRRTAPSPVVQALPVVPPTAFSRHLFDFRFSRSTSPLASHHSCRLLVPFVFLKCSDPTDRSNYRDSIDFRSKSPKCLGSFHRIRSRTPPTTHSYPYVPTYSHI